MFFYSLFSQSFFSFYMKSYPIILLFLLSLFVFSCSDLADLGTGIQPSSDQIKIGTGSFNLTSKTFFVDSIFSRADSFLLGNYYDTKFGSTNAEILAQVNCPLGFTFPPKSHGDSASIALVYTTWAGNAYAPMDVNIYEMNKGKTFSYTGVYPSNIDASAYADQTTANKLAERIFSPKDAITTRADSTAIVFHLNSDFVTRFFDDSKYTSTSKFFDSFKGIYIKANYGSASLLNVSAVNLRYYYHYTYTTKNIHGRDSVVTVNNNLSFPANTEVRQVNRFVHSDRKTVVHPADSVTYVASPANLYTRISVPLNKIQQHMDSVFGSTKLKETINSAMIKVEATNIDVDTVRAPTTKYMMIIKESEVENFFKNHKLPTDTCKYAVLATHTSALVVNSTTVYEDYYKFNIALMIATELQNAKQNKVAPADKLDLVLVPVRVSYNSSGSVTRVIQDYLMDAVTIRSGKNAYSPLHMNLVFSGF